MRSRGTTHIHIEVTQDVLEQLRWLAKRRGVPVKEYIRHCIAFESSAFADPEAEVTVRDTDGYERTFRLRRR